MIELEWRINASPETVFRYLVDPERFVQWMGRRAELDPRPGGRYRLEMDDRNVAVGRYLEVEAPRRLLFSWGWEGPGTVPPESSRVEITLEPEGSATRLRLRHLDLPGDPEDALHREGWVLFIGRLADLFN